MRKILQRSLALLLLLCLLTGCTVTQSIPASTNAPVTENQVTIPPEETLPDGPVTLPTTTEPEETLPDGPVTLPTATEPDQPQDDRPRPEIPEQ